MRTEWNRKRAYVLVGQRRTYHETYVSGCSCVSRATLALTLSLAAPGAQAECFLGGGGPEAVYNLCLIF